MPQLTIEYLQRCFRHFAEICRDDSPLYAALSARIVDEPAVLALALRAAEGQPPVNLLFGAVHFLLLGGASHPLAAFYPSVAGPSPATADGAESAAHGPRRAVQRAWPAFADFCAGHADEITHLVATRRVQTNEVGRCGLLLPAFALAHARLDGRPLHLIEIGASAGLNLLFDRYRYEYSNRHRCGDPGARVIIRTEIRGSGVEVPQRITPVAGRIGIDIAPVDVAGDDAMRWLEALIWPDQLERIALQRQARAVARADPPRVVSGDGLALVPELISSAPASAVPCVFHSYVACQMDEAWRSALADRLARSGRARDLAHVALEWLGDDAWSQLRLTTWRAGFATATHLAECHHHGRWMQMVSA